MSTPTEWQQAAEALVQDVFHANLRMMLLGARSREKVQASLPAGDPILLADGSLALSIGGRVLGAPADDDSQRRTRESIGKGKAAVALVFGLGMGNAVRELVRSRSARVIVFEPDPRLLRRVLEFGPTDLQGIPVYCDLDDLREDWRQVSGGGSTATLVRSPGYAEAYPAELAETEELLRTALSTASVNESTLRVRARSWVENVLENLPWAVGTRPFLSLRGQYVGVPAFIVGAGPSLSRNVHLMPEAARKGIVFAVNSSAGLLARHGTEFQVVASLEAADVSYQMKEIAWLERAIRVLSLSANPATWRWRGGPVMSMFEATAALAGLTDLLGVPGLGVAGSVTTAAFSLAELLGCSPIVFVGQDLAYSGGRLHADGTVMNGSRVRIDRDGKRIRYEWCDEAKKILPQTGATPTEERLMEVEGWGGGEPVVTSAMWNLARDWLDFKARELAVARPGLELINATEGGSRIPGFRDIRLQDVLGWLQDRDITPESMLARAAERCAPLTRERLDAWYAEQAKRTREVGEAATAVAKSVKEAQRAASKGNAKQVRRAYQRLAENEARLRVATALQPMLDAWCCAEVEALAEAGAQAPDSTEMLAAARKAWATELAIAQVIQAGAREMEPKLLQHVTTNQPHPKRTDIPEARRNPCQS